jgi:hypothetical protein
MRNSGSPSAPSANDDGWSHIQTPPDVPVPERKPIEGLKDRAVGALLEPPPLRLDRIEIVVDGKIEDEPRRRAGVARPGSRRMMLHAGVGEDRLRRLGHRELSIAQAGEPRKQISTKRWTPLWKLRARRHGRPTLIQGTAPETGG